MKTVNAWETSDGQIWKYEGDAIRREAKLEFIEWYSNNSIQGIFADELCDWLEDYADAVLRFLELRK